MVLHEKNGLNAQEDAWVERLLFILAMVSCTLPLVVVKGLSQPFLTPRELLLRVLAIVAIPCLILFWSSQVPRKWGGVAWAVGAVLVSSLAATFFSTHPAVSFWGNADRLTGWVTLAELTVLGFVLYTVLLQSGRRRPLLIAWFSAWGVVAVWGIAERIVPGFWAQFNGGGGRSAGLFGNSIFLANSVLAAAAVALPVAFTVRHALLRRVLVSTVVVLAGWCILNTETRGAYVGVAAGVLGMLVMLGVWSRHRWVRAIGIVAPVVLCVGLMSMWVWRAHPGMAAVGEWHPYLSRAISVFNGRDPSQLQRFALWNIAVDAVVARPVVGWGLEQFDTALDRLYRPEFTVFDVANSYSDRAHNVFLDVAVASGAVGLVAYLFLFFALGWRVILAKRSGALSVWGAAAAFGGMAAYLGALLTAFDTIGTLLGLVMGLAVVSAATRQHTDTAARWALPHRLVWPVVGACAVGGVWMIVAAVIPVARASHHVHRAITTQEGQTLLDAARRVRAIAHPYQAQYEMRVANEIFKAVGNAQVGRSEPQDALLAEAEALMRHAVQHMPSYFGTQLMLSNILLLKAAYGSVAVDDALAEIERARTLSPQRQVTYFQAGNAFLVLGDAQRAYDSFEAALALDPTIPESKWHAARGRAAIGDVLGAATLFAQAWRGGYGENRPDSELVVAIHTMIAADDLSLVQTMYSEWVKRPNAPADRWASLAAVAGVNGDTETVVRALRQAVAIDPTLAAEAAAFLAQHGLSPDLLSAPGGGL